jgi:hypothetical protein
MPKSPSKRKLKICNSRTLQPQIKKSKSRTLKPQTKKSKSRTPTRGWAAASPQRGKERKELFNKCGSRCFLLPQTFGYPICEALRVTGKKSACKFDCKGILSAKIRASQNHDSFVLKRAKLMETLYCKTKKKV